MNEDDYELVGVEQVRLGDTVWFFNGDVVITTITEVDNNFVLFEYSRDAHTVGARIKSRVAVVQRRKEQ